MKRTVGGEIEIGMPKRIWTASLSEAEHPREREREDGGREVEAGSVRRQVESKRRRGRETGRGGREGHESMQERQERKGR